jgi:hypothetical protein
MASFLSIIYQIGHSVSSSDSSLHIYFSQYLLMVYTPDVALNTQNGEFTKNNATFTNQNSGSTNQDADFQQQSGLLQATAGDIQGPTDSIP